MIQIYVGNLSNKITDEKLRRLFEPFGSVTGATVILDKKTNESQEYGFVEMSVKSEVRDAIDALRGKDVDGKALRVRVLKPGDEFHHHALSAHGGVPSGPKILSNKSRGDILVRAGGSVRRSGKRGG